MLAAYARQAAHDTRQASFVALWLGSIGQQAAYRRHLLAQKAQAICVRLDHQNACDGPGSVQKRISSQTA